MKKTILAAALVAFSFNALSFNALAADVTVTMQNVVKAETTRMMNEALELAPLNTLYHNRVAINKDNQVIIRSNTDLLYSYGVVDVSKGATFSLPKWTEYQTVELIDINHGIVGVVYPGESISITTEDLTEGNYVYAFVRTAVTAGMDEALKAQDSIRIDTNSAEPFVGMKYNQEQVTFLRQAFAPDAGLARPSLGAYYSKDFDRSKIDLYQYTLVSLLGWGLLPADHANYRALMGVNAGCAEFTFDAPPLKYEQNGYWSVTAYGKDGYIRTDKAAITSADAVANKDGSYTIALGNQCATGYANQLNTPEGYSVLLRMYRPTDTQQVVAYSQALKDSNPIRVVK